MTKDIYYEGLVYELGNFLKVDYPELHEKLGDVIFLKDRQAAIEIINKITEPEVGRDDLIQALGFCFSEVDTVRTS